MTQLNLFGQEATAMVQGLKKTRVKTPKEPSLSDLKWDRRKKYSEIEESKKRIAELQAQDETDWDDTTKCIKGKDSNIPLCENHIKYYQKEIDEMTRKIKLARSQYEPVLNEWKAFIIKYCQEKGKEIDCLFFDTSAPYDCSIQLRMKGHNCYYNCVSFRFTGNQLQAFDSHFGGGTSFVEHLHQTHIDRQNKIIEVMDKVLAGECNDSGWNYDSEKKPYEKKIHEIDEDGWLVDKW